MTAFEQRMAELRARFLDRLTEDARRIEDALAAEDYISVRDICHGLSGNAGMFGFAQLGTMAQAVEEAIDAEAGEQQVRHLASGLLNQLALVQER